MADMLEQANEIQEVLGRSYNTPDGLDEEDLEAGKIVFNCKELDALGEMEFDEAEPTYIDEISSVPSELPSLDEPEKETQQQLEK